MCIMKWHFLVHIGNLKMIILCCNTQVGHIIEHIVWRNFMGLHLLTILDKLANFMINLLTILELGIGLKILSNILPPSVMRFH